jgi:hypothetical protein
MKGLSDTTQNLYRIYIVSEYLGDIFRKEEPTSILPLDTIHATGSNGKPHMNEGNSAARHEISSTLAANPAVALAA